MQSYYRNETCFSVSEEIQYIHCSFCIIWTHLKNTFLAMWGSFFNALESSFICACRMGSSLSDQAVPSSTCIFCFMAHTEAPFIIIFDHYLKLPGCLLALLTAFFLPPMPLLCFTNFHSSLNVNSRVKSATKWSVMIPRPSQGLGPVHSSAEGLVSCSVLGLPLSLSTGLGTLGGQSQFYSSVSVHLPN